MQDPLRDLDIDLNYFNVVYGNHNSPFSGQYMNGGDFNELVSNLDSIDRGFSTIHVNIRSVYSNGDQFVAYLKTLNLKFDAVCFTETWMGADRFLENIFSDYVAYHSMRADRRGGGVSIFISKRLKCNELLNLSCNLDYLECVFVEIWHGKKNIFLGTVYRPPSYVGLNFFTRDLTEKLNYLVCSKNNVILCGDFNLDFLKVNNNDLVAEFYDSMYSLSLVSTIFCPTRITDSSATLIDNIFITCPLNFISGILTADISDHFPVFVIVQNFFAEVFSDSYLEFRLVNDKTLNDLRTNLSSISFIDIVNLESHDGALDRFEDILLKELNVCCPIIRKKLRNTDKTKPWINSFLKGLISEREARYYRFKLFTRS